MITNFLKSKISNLKSNSGYAILFTLIIVSIMMTFAVGMSNSAIKQMILSSTATNSQIAFYQADTAGECALYILTHPDFSLTSGTPISCGEKLDGSPVNLQITQNGSGNYLLEAFPPTSPHDPCFKIRIDTNSSKIESRGYNICDSNSLNQVERGIEITF